MTSFPFLDSSSGPPSFLRFTFATAFITTFLVSGLLIAASDPLGMVLRTGTEAHLVRAGETRALRMAEILYPGDVVTAVQGQVDFLFCPGNEMIQLSAGSSVELTLDSVRALSGAEPSRKEAKTCRLPRVALGTESLERVGGMRARGFAPIEIYLGGNILADRPSFEWEPVEGEPIYRVAVKDDLGILLWEEKTGESQLPYPEARAALNPGGYLWEVTAEVNGETVAQQAARFTLKAEDPELSALVSDESTDPLVRATLLENAGYYSEAADFFRHFRESNPEDPRLTRHLIWLYWNSGLITAASAERERLQAQENQ